jgi:integrase
VRLALGACAATLAGKPAAGSIQRRKRSVFYNALGYAVELGRLGSNPVDRIQWTAPAVAQSVDRRVVVSPAQAEMLLTAVGRLGRRGEHQETFFAVLYYAALRPSEAVMLREANLHLPRSGWGRIVLAASASRAGRPWTDEGTARQERGLKHRADNETRTIPVPPVLVRRLRAHIKRYGTTVDGRIFQTARGGILQDSGYNEVWDEARREALTPAQYRSPLGRPYDLRHAAVSLWLNSGVPATEVARRAGHGVAVLLKIYAHCIDGQADAANQRIIDALGAEAGEGEDGEQGILNRCRARNASAGRDAHGCQRVQLLSRPPPDGCTSSRPPKPPARSRAAFNSGTALTVLAATGIVGWRGGGRAGCRCWAGARPSRPDLRRRGVAGGSSTG